MIFLPHASNIHKDRCFSVLPFEMSNIHSARHRIQVFSFDFAKNRDAFQTWNSLMERSIENFIIVAKSMKIDNIPNAVAENISPCLIDTVL